MATVINVQQYGALGNGVTNDRAAIQAAADAIPWHGGFLYFPGGIYMTSLTGHPADPAYKVGLVLKTATVMKMAPYSSLQLMANQPGSTGGQVAAMVMNSQIGAGGDEHIRLEGVTLEGNQLNQTGVQHGVLLMRTRFAKFTRTRVMNFRGTAGSGTAENFMFDTQLSSDVTFTDCEAIVTSGGLASSGFSANSCTNVEYKGCRAIGMTVANGFTHNNCNNVQHVDCRAFLNTGHGFNSEASFDVQYDNCIAGADAVGAGSTSYPFTTSQSLGNTDTGFVINGTARAWVNNCTARRNSVGLDVPATAGASGGVRGGAFTHNDIGVRVNLNHLTAFTVSGRPQIVSNTTAQLAVPGGHSTYPGAVVAPSVPATTVAHTNQFCADATVYVAGGTVTVIAVNGTATGMTSGPVRVPAGGTITLTYSSVPTWTWFIE